MAVSIDGKISSHGHESDQERLKSGFINDIDQDLVEKELFEADAVIIGAETLRASGRVWLVKNYENIFPPWYIFTKNGFDKGLPFWEQNAVDRVLISPEPLPRETHWSDRVENIAYGNSSPAHFAYDILKQRDYKKVILFGGGYINTMFYQGGLVDGLQLTIAPMIIGKKHASSFIYPRLSESVELELVTSQVSKNHVFLRYSVKNP